MRKSLVYAIFSLLLTSVAHATPESVNGWRQARWGMTEEQVMKTFKGEAVSVEQPKTTLTMRGLVQIPAFSLASTSFEVTFWFADKHLQQISLTKDMSYPGGRNYFRIIESMLREKYGPPATDRSSDNSSPAAWKIDWNLKGSNISLFYVGGSSTGSESLSLTYSKPTSELNRL
jgi:hypothetical protein